MTDDAMPLQGATVGLRYFDKPGMFGMKRYALELHAALLRRGVRVRPQRIVVRELRVGGRRFGGLVSKEVSTWMPRRPTGLVHATSHVINGKWVPAGVVTIHDLIPYTNPELTPFGMAARTRDERRLRRAVDHAKILLTDTAAVKQELIHHFDVAEGKVRPVHLGIQQEQFYPDPSPRHPVYDRRRLNVLVAMNLDLRKRADLVLQAAARLPFVNVVQVGSTDVPPALADRFRDMRSDERRLSAEGRLIHLPWADDDELRRLYSGADLVAHPSAAEGFSFPPLESLACGTPVVASDIPVHREVLGDAVRYVALDAEALAREFDRAWDGTAVRSSAFASPQARLAHARRFTWDETARATLLAYEAALG